MRNICFEDERKIILNSFVLTLVRKENISSTSSIT